MYRITLQYHGFVCLQKVLLVLAVIGVQKTDPLVRFF